MAKPTKSSNAQLIATARDAFTQHSTEWQNKVELLLAMDVSLFNTEELKKHADQIKNARNRAKRAGLYARSMDVEKYAAAFIARAMSADTMTSLQIYAQDKVHAILQAIAAECPLSRIAQGNHANATIQGFIAAIDASGGSMNKRAATAALHTAMGGRITLGTASAQASSSRQALEALGLIENDALGDFKLSEAGEALRAVIAA